jgi:hypothetical protein
VDVGETDATIRGLLGNGLAIAASGIYERRADGVLVFRGERPGEDWNAHGFFKRWLQTVVDGERKRERLLKQRWRHVTGSTCHSRPPDDVAQIHFCTVVVVLCLWAWFVSGDGSEAYDDIFPSLSERPSRRTVQRWMARALAHATSTHQFFRFAAIERGEPRPMKRLFPSGLAPPDEIDRRRWKAAASVDLLRGGLEIAVDSAVSFDVPLALLLAEARGRWTPGEAFLL